MDKQATITWLLGALDCFNATHPSLDHLRPFAMSTASGSHGTPEQRDPRFSHVAEGVVYSQKLILSYHVVVVGILLVLTIVHWSRKWQRARRRRAAIRGEINKSQGVLKSKPLVREDERNGSSSSGSSTVGGDASPPILPRKIEDERTPLLGFYKPWTFWAGFSSRFLAGLIYQPQPIPLVNKVLPSNGATLWTLALVGLNVFYTFYRCPMEISALFIFADRTSVLFVANLPLLYLLAAKNQPMKRLTGYSYESLNMFHRRLGEILCLLALAHSAGMIGVWYTILRPAGWSLLFFLTRKIIILGLFALICYELLYFTSLGSFRQRFYELFLASHVLLQAAALILVFFHHSRSRIYVGTALGIFLLDRVVLRLALKTRQMTASLTLLEDRQTVLVSSEWQLRPHLTWWRKILGLGETIKPGWKPTEHVFITVPSLSRKHIFQAHPFTIASAAPQTSDSHAQLDLLIRAHDGFSKDLLQYSKSHKSTTIRYDGPYGSMEALEMLQDSDVAVVVAGGSGIAVAYPLICALAAQHGAVNCANDLENGCKRKAEKKLCLIWIFHEQSHISWIEAQKLEELRENGIDVIVPPPTRDVGRPDVAWLVKDWVSSRFCASVSDGRIGVVCSGPDGMNRDVRNSCAAMTAQGRNVHVAVEKFGW